VSSYNNKHLLRIKKAIIILEAIYKGIKVKDSEDTITGNLTLVLKLYISYKVMLIRNL